MPITDFERPIKIFYANLLVSGIQLLVDNGKLYVEDTKDVCSPVYQEEIVKRKKHLIEMLTPAPPVELDPYFGRLLKVQEIPQALTVAESVGVKVEATPVNGGWLLTMPKFG